MRFCHLELHLFPVHLGGDHPGQRLKREGRPCNPFQIGKAGNTPASVATHLCLASIRIIKAPFEIGLLRPLDQDDTVCPHGNSSLTDFSDEVLQTIFFQEGVSLIDQDEVFSPRAHLHERNLHQNLRFRKSEIRISKLETNPKLKLPNDLNLIHCCNTLAFWKKISNPPSSPFVKRGKCFTSLWSSFSCQGRAREVGRHFKKSNLNRYFVTCCLFRVSDFGHSNIVSRFDFRASNLFFYQEFRDLFSPDEVLITFSLSDHKHLVIPNQNLRNPGS